MIQTGELCDLRYLWLSRIASVEKDAGGRQLYKRRLSRTNKKAPAVWPGLYKSSGIHALRLQFNMPTPQRPDSNNHALAGNGTGAGVSERVAVNPVESSVKLPLAPGPTAKSSTSPERNDLVILKL